MRPSIKCFRCNAELLSTKYYKIKIEPTVQDTLKPYFNTLQLCSQCYSDFGQWLMFDYVEDSCEF